MRKRELGSAEARDFRQWVVAACPDPTPAANRDFAITHHIDQGRITRGDVPACIALAARLPATQTTPRSTAPPPPITPRFVLASDETARTVTPWVETVREDAFDGVRTPPFTCDVPGLMALTRWFQLHQERYSFPREDTAAISDAREELFTAAHYLTYLTGERVDVAVSETRLDFKYWPGKGESVYGGLIPAPVGSPAFRLARAAEEISDATHFERWSVLRWIFLGIVPLLPPYRISLQWPRISEEAEEHAADLARPTLNRRQVVIEVFAADLSYAEVRELHRRIAAHAGPARRGHAIQERHRHLLDLVAKHGGKPPESGSTAWWRAILKEWNTGIPKRKRIREWRALSNMYRRLTRKLAVNGGQE